MWYKTAKQGSVWSRIGPDAEAQFDELIKQATKRSGNKKIRFIKTKIRNKKTNIRTNKIKTRTSKTNIRINL